jgi:hypothetical protein
MLLNLRLKGSGCILKQKEMEGLPGLPKTHVSFGKVDKVWKELAGGAGSIPQSAKGYTYVQFPAKSAHNGWETSVTLNLELPFITIVDM